MYYLAASIMMVSDDDDFAQIATIRDGEKARKIFPSIFTALLHTHSLHSISKAFTPTETPRSFFCTSRRTNAIVNANERLKTRALVTQ